MNILYIGKSGTLNQKLHSIFAQSSEMTIVSNRELTADSIKSLPTCFDLIILSGRELDFDLIAELSKLNITIKFLSTKVFANYQDAYQLKKKLQENKLGRLDITPVRIPFIEGLFPDKLSKFIVSHGTDGNSPFYISTTDISSIQSSLIGDRVDLKENKQKVNLNSFEKTLVSVFHTLYSLPFLSNISSYLNIVKVLEKGVFTFFGIKMVSTVFIGVDN